MTPIITNKFLSKISGVRKTYLLSILLMVLYSNVQAQFNVSCTSKDLELVEARIKDANLCVSCDPGTPLTKTLVLKIYNKTGSFRTAFAFWGYLVQKDANNNPVDTVPISGCEDTYGIKANSNTEVEFPGVLNYLCGNRLEIINLVMAWTDASPKSNCSTIDPAKINPKCGSLAVVPVNAGLIVSGSVTNGTCNTTTGLPGKGSINATITGGVAPYTFAWTGPSSYTNNNEDISNLNAGLYTLTVTDNSSPTHCVKTATFNVTVATGVDASYNATNGLCSSTTGLAGTGSIDVTPNPTSPPSGSYTYLWTASNGGEIPAGQSDDQDLTGIGSGTYAVKISNTQGCFKNLIDIAITVDPNVDGSADVTNGTCNASGVPTAGSINLTPTPAGTYTYLWTASNGGVIPAGQDDDQDLSGLGAGTYAVKITNTQGCFKNITGLAVTVKARPANASISKVEPTLCGPATGSITVCSPTGGSYQYSKDGGATWQSGTSFGSLAAGSSPSILVKNSDGCWSATPTPCSGAAASCDPPPTAPTHTVVQEQNMTPLGSGELEALLSVKAMPNPFSNQVRFMIKSVYSGMGSLDIYNMQGQKVKNVYSGYIRAGSSYYDLKIADNVNTSQLIYVLSINGEKVTGKLLRVTR